MKKLLVCGAFVALLIPAAPAAAAKKLKPCNTVGLAAFVSDIQKKGTSCADARIVIRSVQAHKAQCAPYREQTIAPYRECVVTPVLSVGARNFFCRSAYETTGDNKRYWRTTCKSFAGNEIHYRRDGNAT